MGNLLDTPIHRLMEQLSTATAAKINHPFVSHVYIHSTCRLICTSSEPQSSAQSSGSSIEDSLWVDRYRPNKFTELLGNERVARDTMSWIKQWDFCVFGSKKGKKRAREDDQNYNPDDDYHRPKEKVLCMSLVWLGNL